MIWLPGVLSQGGEKYTWGRYALKAAPVEKFYNTEKSELQYHTAYAKGYVFHEDTGLFDLDADSYEQPTWETVAAMPIGSVLYSTQRNFGMFYSFDLTGKATIYKGIYVGETTYNGNPAVEMDIYSLTAGNVRGEYIDTVEASDPSAYPDNGQQGDYWYVRYSDTPITWERYEFSWVEVKGASVTQSVSSSTTFYRATTYRKEDGLFKATGTSTRASSLSANNNYLIQNNGAFVNSTDMSGDTLCKITSKSGYSTVKLTFDTFTLAEEKGNYVDTVTSYNPTEYPDDGKQDGYWYVKV